MFIGMRVKCLGSRCQPVGLLQAVGMGRVLYSVRMGEMKVARIGKVVMQHASPEDA